VLNGLPEDLEQAVTKAGSPWTEFDGNFRNSRDQSIKSLGVTIPLREKLVEVHERHYDELLHTLLLVPKAGKKP
jgi:hypothetical protein